MDKTFAHETIIDLPRDLMVQLYVDIDLFPKWQRNFVSHKLVSDAATGEMEVSEVSYKVGGKILTFLRKVLRFDLPDSIVSTFEIDGLRQILVNDFLVMDDDSSKIVTNVTVSTSSDISESDFDSVVLMFLNQTINIHSDFKKFAEGYIQ